MVSFCDFPLYFWIRKHQFYLLVTTVCPTLPNLSRNWGSGTSFTRLRLGAAASGSPVVGKKKNERTILFEGKGQVFTSDTFFQKVEDQKARKEAVTAKKISNAASRAARKEAQAKLEGCIPDGGFFRSM